MARAGKRLRETAEKVLAKRDGGSEDGDLLGRLVTARDPLQPVVPCLRGSSSTTS